MRHPRTHTHPAYTIHRAAEDLTAALLTLDEEAIKLCARRWGLSLPLDEHTFWLVVHKARTGLPTLPERERAQSREWLRERGFSSFSANT